MVVYIIAVAGALGSLVGAFFRVRVMALLWSLPILCVLYGAAVFVAPFVRKNEALPETFRTLMLEFADISLFIPVLVAGAAGTLIASSLTRQVRESQMASPRLRQATARSRGTRAEQLVDRAQSVTRPRAPVAFDQAVTPVFEVTPEPAAAPIPQPRPGPTPPPPAENRRRHGRRRAVLAGEAVFADGASARCTIQDLSVAGARVRLAEPWPEAPLVRLLDHTNGLAHDAVIKWRRGATAGLRFTASRELKGGQP